MEELAVGHSVTVPASEVVLNPAEVGKSMGLSRLLVAKLIDSSDIEAQHLPDGSRPVVRSSEVLKCQQRRERRREGRRRIAEVIESEGLSY